LAPAVIILAAQALFIAGYAQSAQGLAQYRPISDMIWKIDPDAQVYNAHPRGKRPPPEIALYLNRVIEWTNEPLEIKQGGVTKFQLIPQNKGEPDPSFPSPWQVLDQRGPANDRWWTFILPLAKP